MAVENMSSTGNSKEEDDVPLPGFRFHPTDEELVGFYLQRKVQKKSLSIELIKQADIYKYDPWDLIPKFNNVGDQEYWYFFCKRGRKYRNSIRPNRVTGSGFWKATGIDKPIYSSGHDCVIGLKKSLVYYRGSAGKGTKTDWMMHEFRLPSGPDHKIHSPKNLDSKTDIAQEAEVWTLCRILKRNNSYRKLTVPDWREVTAPKRPSIDPLMDASSKTCSMESSVKNSSYINFNFTTSPVLGLEIEKKPCSYDIHNTANQQFPAHFSSTSIKSQAPASIASSSSSMCGDINELKDAAGDWEDLRSILDYSSISPAMNPFYL